jgi:NTE family protein
MSNHLLLKKETDRPMMDFMNAGNKRVFLYRALLFLFFCFVSFIFSSAPAAAGQNEPAQNQSRPRVGLVLSGGGARGISHIGVIKVLEEMRVPVDFITGTSMGAIVGGLYAAGMSPDDLEKLVTGIDWDNAFTDRPAVDELAFRRKQDSQRYKIDVDLGYRDGKFAMPKGMIQGQNLNVLLKTLLLHTADVKDFDNLRIPFRAVAADIETGDQVILQSGDLAQAIRASMSIPGVFAPVEIGGRMLVDGGIANNLPADIARQMGADIIIAVDIGTPLRSRENLSSAASITAQVMTILIQKNMQAQLANMKKEDIVIQPVLGNIGTSDFSNAARTLSLGYEAADKVRNRLAALSVGPGLYQKYLAQQRKGSTKEPVIDYVRVENNSPLAPQVLEAQIETKAGETLNPEKLVRDTRRLYGLDTFESVDFRLENINKQTGLVFTTNEKSWGDTFIKFGFSMADNFKGENTYSVGASVTKTGLNALGGEWRTEFQIGDSPRVFTEFYQPLTSSTRFFINPQAEFRQRNVNIFDHNGNIVAQYLIRYMAGGLGVGRQLGNWGEIRLGLFRAYGGYKVNIGDPALPSDSFNEGGLITSFSYNTLDRFDFPTRGAEIDAIITNNFQALGADDNANSLTLSWQVVKTWGKYTFIPGILYSGFFNSNETIENSYNIGGFFNLSGYSPNELSGRQVGVTRVIFYRNMGSVGLGSFRNQLYLGGSAEAGNAWQPKEDITLDSLIYAGSVFVGLNTFLGPVFLAYGLAEGGHQTIGLSLGQRF